jgi:hypothetical protein
LCIVHITIHLCIVLYADSFFGMTFRAHCYLIHVVFFVFSIVAVLVKLALFSYFAIVFVLN